MFLDYTQRKKQDLNKEQDYIGQIEPIDSRPSSLVESIQNVGSMGKTPQTRDSGGEIGSSVSSGTSDGASSGMSGGSGSSWAGAASSLLQLGGTVAQTSAQAGAMHEAERKTKMMSHVMQKIALIQQRKEELKELGRLREAKEYGEDIKVQQEEEKGFRDRNRAYQVGRGEIGDILQGLNNSPVMRNRMVDIISSRR